MCFGVSTQQHSKHTTGTEERVFQPLIDVQSVTPQSLRLLTSFGRWLELFISELEPGLSHTH